MWTVGQWWEGVRKVGGSGEGEERGVDGRRVVGRGGKGYGR